MRVTSTNTFVNLINNIKLNPIFHISQSDKGLL